MSGKIILRINIVIIKEGTREKKKTAKLWQSKLHGDREASKTPVSFKEATFHPPKNAGFGMKVTYCGKTKEIKLFFILLTPISFIPSVSLAW
jgi:hypothetical protein